MGLKPHILTKLGLKQKSIWQSTLQNISHRFGTFPGFEPRTQVLI
jgi:hypothetical protein